MALRRCTRALACTGVRREPFTIRRSFL